MGVLQSIPLCSRGNRMVEPLDLDKNNNNLEEAEIHTSQPHHASLPPPEATSTPRPQSPTGIINDQYSDSLSSENEAHAGRPGAALSSGHDSGLEESATEFEFSRPTPDSMPEFDEGVHEETYDDNLVLDVIEDDQEEIDLKDEEEDPLERPPEPTVPDERVSSDGEAEELEIHEQPETDYTPKDETTRKISSMLSELVGDRPNNVVSSVVETR